MKKTRNKKKWITGTIGLASLALLAGTFAWFSSSDSKTNHFEGQKATSGDLDIIEDFVPPTNWTPNQSVKKAVSILNTGESDAMIRVSFEEVVQKLKDGKAYFTEGVDLEGKTKADTVISTFDETTLVNFVESKVTPKTVEVTSGDFAGTYTLKAKEKAVTTDSGTAYQYVSYWDNGTDKYYAKVNSFTRAADGTLTANKAEFKYTSITYNEPVKVNWTSPVYQPTTFTIDANGNARLTSANDTNIEIGFMNLSESPTVGKWTYNSGDGYFYYVGIVKSNEPTPQVISDVKLREQADNSYSAFKYDLVVNALSIQATKEAVNGDGWLNNTNPDLATKYSELLN